VPADNVRCVLDAVEWGGTAKTGAVPDGEPAGRSLEDVAEPSPKLTLTGRKALARGLR
jgi:hypothetical protein